MDNLHNAIKRVLDKPFGQSIKKKCMLSFQIEIKHIKHINHIKKSTNSNKSSLCHFQKF